MELYISCFVAALGIVAIVAIIKFENLSLKISYRDNFFELNGENRNQKYSMDRRKDS
jgi:hypothetical protein